MQMIIKNDTENIFILPIYLKKKIEWKENISIYIKWKSGSQKEI